MSTDIPDEPSDLENHPSPAPAQHGSNVDTDGAVDDEALSPEDVLPGEVDEHDVPAEIAVAVAGIRGSAREALRGFRFRQFTAIFDSLAPVQRNVEITYGLLGQFDATRLMGPVVEQFKPALDLNERIGAQMAAALPGAQFNKQLEQVANIAKNIVPRGVLGNFQLPESAFKNFYGDEFSGIASRLASFQKVFEGVDWEGITTDWFPPNWDSERGVRQYETFIKLAAEEGLPMTWVPNTELTYLLAEAENTAARNLLLIEHSMTIVEDCRTVLAELEDQTYLVSQLVKSLDAYAAGFHEQAQSHVASIVDTALREVFVVEKRWTYPTVKKLLHNGEDWRRIKMRSARVLPTSVALLNLLKDFWTDRGDAVPTMPNRHAAAHAVHADQYHEVNALKFLMLATAMLAEVEYGGWRCILNSAA